MDHTVFPVNITISAFTPQSQSITALWPVLIAPTHEGMARLSWSGWLVRLRQISRTGSWTPIWSPIPVLTGPGVEQLRWSDQRRYQLRQTATQCLLLGQRNRQTELYTKNRLKYDPATSHVLAYLHHWFANVNCSCISTTYKLKATTVTQQIED